jgi:hypothetical protein
MKELDRNYKETIEPPRELHYWNIMYWCPETKELCRIDEKGNKVHSDILTKANKFLEEDCISQISPSEWIVSPIKGYNTTPYHISLSNGNLSCNCQGFKNNYKCSHTLAVQMFKYMTEYNERRKNEN